MILNEAHEFAVWLHLHNSAGNQAHYQVNRHSLVNDELEDFFIQGREDALGEFRA